MAVKSFIVQAPGVKQWLVSNLRSQGSVGEGSTIVLTPQPNLTKLFGPAYVGISSNHLYFDFSCAIVCCKLRQKQFYNNRPGTNFQTRLTLFVS